MSSQFNPTETEREIFDSASRLLGPNLADYLLSGLGETHATYRRAFTARGASRHSDNVTYGFEMTCESDQGLPRGRDPLVLAALLALLWKYQSLNGTFRFEEVEVIEELGWPLGAESRLLVKRALEKYLLAAFRLTDPNVTEEKCIFGRYASFRRLLVGYEITLVGMNLNRAGDQGQIQLTFLPEFVECVVSESKRFLGVEFQRLRGMREITAEGTGMLKDR